jgi:selenocysteine-specific translation elongation factor
MPNLSVVVIAPIDYSKDLGKKGTSSDITLYDAKRGESTVSFIEATKYPERLAPLFFACSMAESALLVVDEVNAQFGECVLMLDAIGIKEGRIILRNFISPDRIAPLVKGTVIEGYKYIEEELAALRERYLDEAEVRTVAAEEGEVGSVPVDHHFNVKGVGTVTLGYVANGKILRHATLKALPGKKEVIVRSIQKHDDDFEIATQGDRVGLALKNIDSDELDRGSVLTNDPSIKEDKSFEAKVKLVKYWPTPLKEGMVMHIGHWMQFIPARIINVASSESWKEPQVRFELEKELVHLSGSNAVLCYLEGGKLRIAGTMRLP